MGRGREKQELCEVQFQILNLIFGSQHWLILMTAESMKGQLVFQYILLLKLLLNLTLDKLNWKVRGIVWPCYSIVVSVSRVTTFRLSVKILSY